MEVIDLNKEIFSLVDNEAARTLFVNVVDILSDIL
jgi:hypothetical protein